MGCCHRSKGGSRRAVNVKMPKKSLPSTPRPGKRRDRRKLGLK